MVPSTSFSPGHNNDRLLDSSAAVSLAASMHAAAIAAANPLLHTISPSRVSLRAGHHRAATTAASKLSQHHHNQQQQWTTTDDHKPLSGNSNSSMPAAASQEATQQAIVDAITAAIARKPSFASASEPPTLSTKMIDKYSAFGQFLAASLADLPEMKALDLIADFTIRTVNALKECKTVKLAAETGTPAYGIQIRDNKQEAGGRNNMSSNSRINDNNANKSNNDINSPKSDHIDTAPEVPQPPPPPTAAPINGGDGLADEGEGASSIE